MFRCSPTSINLMVTEDILNFSDFSCCCHCFGFTSHYIFIFQNAHQGVQIVQLVAQREALIKSGSKIHSALYTVTR